MLNPEKCWKFLIEINCVEGIKVWLKIKEPPHLYPWPIDLFQQWTITQKMIDSIHNFVCTHCTKEVVLNCLSL